MFHLWGGSCCTQGPPTLLKPFTVLLLISVPKPCFKGGTGGRSLYICSGTLYKFINLSYFPTCMESHLCTFHHHLHSLREDHVPYIEYQAGV